MMGLHFGNAAKILGLWTTDLWLQYLLQTFLSHF